MAVNTGKKTKRINSIRVLYDAAKNGSYKTRLSFLVMGFGQVAEGQIVKGLLYMLVQGLFWTLDEGKGKKMLFDALRKTGLQIFLLGN